MGGLAKVLGGRRLGGDTGSDRFFRDQTYHHAVLRALNHVPVGGADVSEVLHAVTGVRAGDESGWFAAWSALGQRNTVRAEATRDRISRGQALLRAHTYHARAQFYLSADDPRRPDSYQLSRACFYRGLEELQIPFRAFEVPYGRHHLDAVYYPAPSPAGGPLIVFHGGYDTIKEELYFFLAAAATARGYSVLTFDGPGQGAPLREQGLLFTHEWEKPVAAVLDAFAAHYSMPDAIVLVGLSMGGYLAPRAAAFEPRIDGVVSYDIFFDMHDALWRAFPPAVRRLHNWGSRRLVDRLAATATQWDPAVKWGLNTAGWALGCDGLTDMLNAAKQYTLEPVADRIRQDVLILAGTEDQFIPIQQVDRFRRSLTNARSVTTKIYDPETGGHEHSQLGASSLWQADFFDWIHTRFEQ